ncbi:hypothetical protein ACFVWL_06235 [Microbacterium sp. NPDC058269]|uniref:hypothetical protein n=1 Tax=Microbacterium sp. NPDC058269 TaxID=3346414 RepID=UPI0036DC4A15
MPHLIVDAGTTLPAELVERALFDAHAALLTSGEVQDPRDLKSRSRRVESSIVGAFDSSGPGAFLHAELLLLPGRPYATMQHLGQLVLDAVAAALAGIPAELSVEVRELARPYLKHRATTSAQDTLDD